MEQYLNGSTKYCSENIVDLISYTATYIGWFKEDRNEEIERYSSRLQDEDSWGFADCCAEG